MSELRSIVAESEKKRFSLIPVSEAPSSAPLSRSTTPSKANDTTTEPVQSPVAVATLPSEPSDDPSDYLIRANQGHSLAVASESLLTPITATNMPATVVHGTVHGAWHLILASGGLKRMGRNHVHFAAGLPPNFKTLLPAAATADDDVDDDDQTAAQSRATVSVISGMRASSTLLIYLDLPKAMAAGLAFGVSENGVILCEGDERGVVGTGGGSHGGGWRVDG
ncbi:tRNA 2'-phosphotransferase [Elasticomyces elasticus]|nr:tRNA 2'-phosphotransferase [Elasticomyces elasticus]